MSNLKRKSRRKVLQADDLEAAWDDGLPPTPDAADPARRDDVIDCIFFRWADTAPRWEGHHPHIAEWLGVMRSSEPCSAN